MDLFDDEIKTVQREYGISNDSISPTRENPQASQNEVDDFFENFQQQMKIRFVKLNEGVNNKSEDQPQQCLNKKFETEETPKILQASKGCIMRGLSLQNGNYLSQDSSQFQSENNDNYFELQSSHRAGKAIKINSIEQVLFLPQIVRNCFRAQAIIEDSQNNSKKSVQTQGEVSSPIEENIKKMLKQCDECNSGDNNIFNIRDRKLQRQRILSLQVRPQAQQVIQPQNESVFSNKNNQFTMNQSNIPNPKLNAQLQKFKSQDFNQESSLRSFHQPWKGNSNQQSVLKEHQAQQNEGFTQRFFRQQQQNTQTQKQFKPLRDSNKQNDQILKMKWNQSLSTNQTSNCSLSSNPLAFPSLKTASPFDESSSFDWSGSLASLIKGQSNLILSKNQFGIQPISEQSQGSLPSDQPIKKKKIKISKESAFARIIEQDFQENTQIASQKNQDLLLFSNTKIYRDEEKENIEPNSLKEYSCQIQQQTTLEKEISKSMNINKGSKESRIFQKKKRY